MRRSVRAIGRAVKAVLVGIARAVMFPFSLFELRDLLVFGGIGLAAYGADLIYQPAAYIGAGVALFIVGKFPGLGSIRTNGNPQSS